MSALFYELSHRFGPAKDIFQFSDEVMLPLMFVQDKGPETIQISNLNICDHNQWVFILLCSVESNQGNSSGL